VRLRFLSLCAVLALFAGVAAAQACNMKPPDNARLAIMEFYDLECPSCAQWNPTLMDAQKQYKLPWVHLDFPIPSHHWSRHAALYAAWFDTKSPELGDAYRNEVYAHQPEITPGNLRDFTEKFARAHKVDLPFAIDPQGKLEQKINADYNLGVSRGVEHTPTVCVVANGVTSGPSYIEVGESTQLFAAIDQMKRALPPEAAKPASTKKGTTKKTGKTTKKSASTTTP
jgi:protein-disulfide isomerase